MGARVQSDGSASAMRSPINWAVLGLLIEHPGHAYELFQRFDSAYAGAIELSSNSQMNGALKALRERGLIERLADDEEGGDRSPFGTRPYRPTAEGIRAYEEHLMAWSPRSAEPPGVFARQLAVLPAATALAVIERYEQACLSETCGSRVPGATASAGGRALDPLAFEERLIAEEKYLALAAKIEWARNTRSLIKTFSRARAAAGLGAANGRGAAPADGSADAAISQPSVRRSGGLESVS